MLYRKTWLILLLVALTALWGCSDDDDPTQPVDSFETVATAALEYVNSTDCPGTMSSSTLETELAAWQVIDVRDLEDFQAGHIPGAVHATLPTLLDVVDAQGWPMDEPICVTCYTGQSAGHAKIALELLGYDNVKTLSFGMSAWNSIQCDSWSSQVGDQLGTFEVTNNNPSLTEVGFPSLDGNLESRVRATLAAGFKAKSFSVILDNLENYFIINYFGELDYLGQGSVGVPGHIPGAYQFSPRQSLALDAMLDTLPTDGTEIIVYCWTGQHSSQVTFFLNMLGYNAYSLKFGANQLFHSDLDDNDWDTDAVYDYDLASGFTPSATFQTIADEMAAYLNDRDDCPGGISASSLELQLDNWQVLDIRSATDYNTGHIPGAINVQLPDVLTAVAAQGWPSDEPIAVVCKTGQSAGHAKIALELSGYDNVKWMTYGMCSWDADLTAPWDSQTFGAGTPDSPDGSGDVLTPIEQSDNNPEMAWYDFPPIPAGDTVADRVADMLAADFQAVTFESIQDNLENYFIVNYFGELDYLGQGSVGVPGHIPGAYQFTPFESMGWDQMLGHLPSDGSEIIVYCWTGQHSSQVTAYLNMLGYNAKSLLFGSNHLFYSDLGPTSSHWAGNDVDRTLETTPIN